jgi:hypothetical protein
MTSQAMKMAEIAAEIAELSKQQTKAIHDATYLGWRDGERAAYDQRSDRLVFLRQKLALLDGADNGGDQPAVSVTND